MATEERSDAQRFTSAMSDLANLKRDYSPRFFRSGILSFVEAFRLTADAFGTFTQKILDTDRLNEPEGLVEFSRQFPADVAEGIADATRSLIDIPTRAAQKFADTYPKPDEKK